MCLNVDNFVVVFICCCMWFEDRRGVTFYILDKAYIYKKKLHLRLTHKNTIHTYLCIYIHIYMHIFMFVFA